jgi:hypothetical protein
VLVVVATIQHVLGRIDIRCITLAAPPPQMGGAKLLVRFDGLQGSLEISTRSVYADTELRNALFGPRGVLFSHSPHTENVRELHVVGCFFGGGSGLYHINTALPNLVSISFHWNGPRIFELLAPTNPSSPPFPHLERVMIIGPESGLEEMARKRRDCGVPLKMLVVGRGPGGFEYDHLENYAALGELVGDLHVGCPAEILEWGSRNEIFNFWSTIETPGLVSLDGNLKAMG